jgi:hypothetical protein
MAQLFGYPLPRRRAVRHRGSDEPWQSFNPPCGDSVWRVATYARSAYRICFTATAMMPISAPCATSGESTTNSWHNNRDQPRRRQDLALPRTAHQGRLTTASHGRTFRGVTCDAWTGIRHDRILVLAMSLVSALGAPSDALSYALDRRLDTQLS